VEKLRDDVPRGFGCETIRRWDAREPKSRKERQAIDELLKKTEGKR